MNFAEPDPPDELVEGAIRGLSKTATGAPKVSTLLSEVAGIASAAVSQTIKFEDRDDFPDLNAYPANGGLYTTKSIWVRLKNCVVVSCDLKNSTRLTFKKYVNTGAKIYEASTGPMVRMLRAFRPEFVDIQGDGVFAIYHGERAAERAICAAITVKTYSQNVLVPKLGRLLGDEAPDTGIKTGMCSGTIIARRLGMQGDREPVWAGRPVNYAFKCAQAADADELIVTKDVYDRIERIDYLTHSCGHSRRLDGTLISQPEGVAEVWQPTMVAKLGDHSSCWSLSNVWCDECGDLFVARIIAGDKRRNDVHRA